MNDNGRIVGGVSNENAFRNCATKTVIKDGVEVEFPNFDAHDWSAAYGGYSIGGNMWAPDVIYNDTMEKWCMYMSINGPQWNSSIVLLTADRITGPYVYQGPVIVSGFNVSGCPASLDYKNTDM
jgi:arabinan endo-1,5-alpha-L-arabinosidase